VFARASTHVSISSSCGVAPPLLLSTLLTQWPEVNRYLTSLGAYSRVTMLRLEIPLSSRVFVSAAALIALACIAWQCAFWWFALSRGLRMQRPLLLWVFMCVGGCAGAAISLTLRDLL